jgi:hypothetical protein
MNDYYKSTDDPLEVPHKLWRTITNKDFIFKVSLSVKELKESRNSLKF